MPGAVVVPGTVAGLKASDALTGSVWLQVSGLQEGGNGKYKCQFTDGQENIPGVLTSQVGKRHGATLKNNDMVEITEANINSVEDKKVLVVADLNVSAVSEGLLSPSPAPAAKAKSEEVPASTPSKPPVPSPYGTAATPANHPTPPSAGWAARIGTTASLSSQSSTGRPVQPIAALNPYNNTWSIKAKVVSKGNKRSFSRNGTTTSVFSVELVDDSGTSIEATFWREAADRWYNLLEESGVYLMSRGAVKPANRKFSAVRNDYTLHFDSNTEIERLADDAVDASAMQAKIDVVPICQLAAFADKKATVDVLGVVIAAGALGSVKRKSDSAELARRDITLVDQGQKTVVLTLWGNVAEGIGAEIEAQAAENPILAVSHCRVSAFNGVSVSALQRSVISINPSNDAAPGAEALRTWWTSQGSVETASFTAVGEGLAGARTPGAAAAQTHLSLSEIKASAPATSDGKPVFSSTTATVASINPDQTLYYPANPENNRKVVETGDGQWYCEFSGTTLPSMVRRYILQARVVDESGECFVQVFNDQAQSLLGMAADDLADLKERDAAKFLAVIKGASWKDWSLRIKASTQEYNGEQRHRYAVAELRSLDFVRESKRLLSLINGSPAA